MCCLPAAAPWTLAGSKRPQLGRGPCARRLVAAISAWQRLGGQRSRAPSSAQVPEGQRLQQGTAMAGPLWAFCSLLSASKVVVLAGGPLQDAVSGAPQWPLPAGVACASRPGTSMPAGSRWLLATFRWTRLARCRTEACQRLAHGAATPASGTCGRNPPASLCPHSPATTMPRDPPRQHSSTTTLLPPTERVDGVRCRLSAWSCCGQRQLRSRLCWRCRQRRPDRLPSTGFQDSSATASQWLAGPPPPPQPGPPTSRASSRLRRPGRAPTVVGGRSGRGSAALQRHRWALPARWQWAVSWAPIEALASGPCVPSRSIAAQRLSMRRTRKGCQVSAPSLLRPTACASKSPSCSKKEGCTLPRAYLSAAAMPSAGAGRQRPPCAEAAGGC